MSFTNTPKFQFNPQPNQRWIHSGKCTYKETYDNGEHRYIFTGPCSIFPEHTHTVSILGHELFMFNQKDDLMQLRSLCPEDREWVNTGISPKGWAHIFPSEEDDEATRDFNIGIETHPFPAY